MQIVETRLWRCTYDNELVEDITPYFVEAGVSMDPENDETWTMEVVMSWEGWKKLDVFEDWIAPVLHVWYPNGLYRYGQLGRYFVLDSPESHSEITAKVKLTCGDPLWLLARQEFHDILEVLENEKKTRVVQKILSQAILTEAQGGRRLYAIPEREQRFKRKREWDPELSVLEIANEILHSAGCYPLWTNKKGVITSKIMGEARLKNRHPIRTYSANLPDTVFLLPNERPLGGLISEVVGVIDTSPQGDDLINDALVINDSLHGDRVQVRGKITHPQNPRSVFRRKKDGKRRRKVRKIHNPVIDEDATAEEVAKTILDEISTRNKTAKLSVLPDPHPDFARGTIACHIYNLSGEGVLVGQYAVHRVSYGLRPSSATMTFDIGRIDDADDVLEDEEDVA